MYDIIVIGGGLGGAAFAKAMAEGGARVLVLERDTQFKDRVRGEWIAPWGVAETQKLGLYNALLERCAHEVPYWKDVMQPARDFRTTTPQGLPVLTVYHPMMQDTVLDCASNSGAEVWRGATVRGLKPGSQPLAIVEHESRSSELTARLVVCADGRNSTCRAWGGFATIRGTQKLLGAGILLENLSIDDDATHNALNPFVPRWALLVPQGKGRARAYCFYRSDVERLQGADDTVRFIEESIKSGLPVDMYAGAKPAGPLASFDMTETWVDHPYRSGVVLLGDAAGASDPSWGQGLSLTLRDARILAENLLSSDDWDAAAHAYAAAHDRYFSVERIVGQWAFDLFFAGDVEADTRRARALPLL
ncbi:MAG TPA: FAD-dependent monooxygenase, partial [Candidatus Binataceae bacterium]|nr:FAD-dependent monooxygenase [Candidatus Binataceae bacterium]